MIGSARGIASGLKEAARVALAGRRFLDDVAYSLHVGTEGRTESAVHDALVKTVRGHLTALFLERGATRLQISTTYRYREGLRPEAWRLVEALKHAVDERGLVDPGAHLDSPRRIHTGRPQCGGRE